MWCLPMASEEGEEDRSGAPGSVADAHDSGPGVGRDSDHGDVVEVGPGPGHPAAVR
jgi:hypothetical protein